MKRLVIILAMAAMMVSCKEKPAGEIVPIELTPSVSITQQEILALGYGPRAVGVQEIKGTVYKITAG